MTAQLLDGKAVAQRVTADVASRVERFRSQGHAAPGLAVVLVGEDPASQVYVRNKRRTTEATGMRSFAHDLPATTTREELLALIRTLNGDDRVDGILLQLPLPKGLDSTEIMDTIDPAKDVDGFHPTNTGLLAQKRPGLRPCTPRGVIKLAEEYKLDLVGFSSAFPAEERSVMAKMLGKLRGGPGFTGKAPGGPSRWSPGKSGDYIALDHKLVAEVVYDQVTAGRFRHAARFLRWRPDKAPRQCDREQLIRELRPAEMLQLTGAD